MLLVLGTRMLLVSGIATKTKKTDGSIVSLSQGNRFKPDPHVQTNPQYHTIDNNIYIYILNICIIISGWWFQACVSHNIWDNPSHWLSYFSRWLKPPTRHIYICNTFYPHNLVGYFTIIFHAVNLLMFWWLNPPYFSLSQVVILLVPTSRWFCETHEPIGILGAWNVVGFHSHGESPLDGFF